MWWYPSTQSIPWILMAYTQHANKVRTAGLIAFSSSPGLSKPCRHANLQEATSHGGSVIPWTMASTHFSWRSTKARTRSLLSQQGHPLSSLLILSTRSFKSSSFFFLSLLLLGTCNFQTAFFLSGACSVAVQGYSSLHQACQLENVITKYQYSYVLLRFI